MIYNLMLLELTKCTNDDKESPFYDWICNMPVEHQGQLGRCDFNLLNVLTIHGLQPD